MFSPASCCSGWPPLPPGSQPRAKKQLIAHRGASGYAPEHTLDAYRLAMTQGADFVEQDLAVTKDGELVCIHDLTLERTTNVEDVFPDRVGAGSGAAVRTSAGWSADFTLAEIKRLDAGSWFDPKFAGARIPTFQEAIDLVRGKAGLYPELKDPAFYRDRGVHPDVLLAAALEKNHLIGDPTTPVIIQSFDEVTIKALATQPAEGPASMAGRAARRRAPRFPGQAEGDRGLGDRHRAEQGDRHGAAGDRRRGRTRPGSR